MELNNREIASLIWTIMIAAAVLWSSSIRKAIWVFIKAVMRPPSLLYFGAAGLYIGACIMLLRWWGIWTTDNLKTTIGWVIAFAIASMVKANQIDEDRTYFGRTLRETIGITVLLVFILGLQSFSLWAELLIVPVVSFLALLQGIADKDEKLAPASRTISALTSLIVLSIFAYSLYVTVADWPKFEIRKNLSELLVPILLSLLFLPFLYWTSVILVYQRNFRSMDFALPTKALIRFAKQRALFEFRSNLPELKRWRHGKALLFCEELQRPEAPPAGRYLVPAGFLTLRIEDRADVEALEQATPGDRVRKAVDRHAGLDPPDVGLRELKAVERNIARRIEGQLG